MSSEKMGLFISELRKSLQMTQRELAAKLNITDKAVSKWERGLSYPDISLLSPLAKILGITAGELINCERISDSNSSTETNIAIDNVLQYADKAVRIKTKSTRKWVMLAAVGVIILFLGSYLLMFPIISRHRNTRIQRGIIRDYLAEVALLPQEAISEHFRRAEEHNSVLSGLPPGAGLLVAHLATIADDYYEILYVGGIIGRVEIPAIDIDMPIFHGTGSRSLERGAGLLEGTGFPIGGYGNHPVIVAHNGLSTSGLSTVSTAEMFKGLDQDIQIGDLFYISVLDRRLTYRVDTINIILPHEINELRIIPDADIVTLMTYVPYRINSHRLLVRGTRVP